MSIWIGTYISFSVNRSESLLGGIAINAAVFHLSANQVPHQHNAGLIGAGHHYGRPIDARVFAHTNLPETIIVAFAASLRKTW